jgi:hypothetical protein
MSKNVQIPKYEGKKKLFIKYNGTNIHNLASFDGKQMSWFQPGWNEFPADIWKQYEKNDDIIDGLENKLFEVYKSPGKKTPLLAEEFNVKDMDEKTAISVVTSTWVRPLLQRWQDEETHHKVKRALDKQLKPLMPGAKNES